MTRTQLNRYLLFVEKERAEAELCRTWRLLTRADAVITVALATAATVCFVRGVPLTGAAFTLTWLRHAQLTIRFTRQCRSILGFWPWRG